jgi:hypothetical protein
MLKARPDVGMKFNLFRGAGLAMKIHKVLQPYCSLMQDIKTRVAAMLILAQNRTGLPDPAAFECEQLQIRMISETLAVACLLVHGDVEGARNARLSKAYQADKIMNALEKLHPRFYPRPINQILRDGVPVAIEDIKEGFLTKEEMLKSYREAAGFLHVGSLNEFLANERAISDRQSVRAWARTLTMLLSHHCIFLADEPDGTESLKFADGEPAPKFQIIVQMRTGADERPQATVFQTIRQA